MRWQKGLVDALGGVSASVRIFCRSRCLQRCPFSFNALYYARALPLLPRVRQWGVRFCTVEESYRGNKRARACTSSELQTLQSLPNRTCSRTDGFFAHTSSIAAFTVRDCTVYFFPFTCISHIRALRFVCIDRNKYLYTFDSRLAYNSAPPRETLLLPGCYHFCCVFLRADK